MRWLKIKTEQYTVVEHPVAAMSVLLEPSTASEGKRNAKELSAILAFWISASPGMETSNQKITF